MNKILSQRPQGQRKNTKTTKPPIEAKGEMAELNKKEIEIPKDLPENNRLTITVKRSKNKLEWIINPINSWHDKTVTISTREARKHVPVAMATYITHIKTVDPNLYKKLIGKNSALAKLVKPELMGRPLLGTENQGTKNLSLYERKYREAHWMDRPVRLEPINLSATRKSTREPHSF